MLPESSALSLTNISNNRQPARTLEPERVANPFSSRGATSEYLQAFRSMEWASTNSKYKSLLDSGQSDQSEPRKGFKSRIDSVARRLMSAPSTVVPLNASLTLFRRLKMSGGTPAVQFSNSVLAPDPNVT